LDKAVKHPSLGERDVKISVKAAAVTSKDLRQVHGLANGVKVGSVAGNTAVGVVSAIGSDVSSVAVNDPVYVLTNGTWSDTVITDRGSVVKMGSSSSPTPDHFKAAAQFPVALSAWVMLTQGINLKVNDTVVVDKLSTPIGNVLSQLGKLLNVKVVESSKDMKGVAALAICSNTNMMKDCLKSLQSSGSLVIYEDKVESIENAQPLQVSYSAAIFNDVRVRGFDLCTWAKQHPALVQTGVSAIDDFVRDKKLNLTASNITTVKIDEYKNAVAACEKDSVAVLTM